MHTLLLILVLAGPFVILWLLIAFLIVTIGRETGRT